MPPVYRWAALILFLALLLTACASSASPTPGTGGSQTRPDPATPEGQGMALFMGQGRCATCHSLSPETVIVGPSLAGIATRAETRIAGLSAAEYIEESILRPDLYRPPGFENQQMDTSLAKTLTVEEVEALVAYLMTLK